MSDWRNGALAVKTVSRSQGTGFLAVTPVLGPGDHAGAASALIDEVIRQAPNTLIVTSANHDNLRSQCVIRSIGFVRDGDDEIFSSLLQRPVMTVCYRRP